MYAENSWSVYFTDGRLYCIRHFGAILSFASIIWISYVTHYDYLSYNYVNDT